MSLMMFWHRCSLPPVPPSPHNLFFPPNFFSHRLHLLPISLLWPKLIERLPFCRRRPSLLYPLQHECHLFSPVRSVALLSLLFLHRSFHLVGSLYRPVVAEREPDPRPLSLAPPTMPCAQRGGASPVQRTVLMRANSFPSHGHRFPVLPAGEERMIGGFLQDERGPPL